MWKWFFDILQTKPLIAINLNKESYTLEALTGSEASYKIFEGIFGFILYDLQKMRGQTIEVPIRNL